MSATSVKNLSKKRISLSKLAVVFGVLFILFLVGCAAFWHLILKDLPSPTKLGYSNVAQTTKILDRNGKLLYNVYEDQNRTLVKLTDIPLMMRQATLSIEDKDFYQHGAVNPVGGMLRAARDTLLRRKLQGGSTITQQLVKTALLSQERTVIRKIREIILATWTESTYSKDQILEMYLNQVPYGGTAWGVEAAAQMYFGKSIKDVNLAEAALLAGLPNAPSLYSPYGAYPDLAKKRQELVLSRMVEDGYIKSEQKDEALAVELTFRKPTTDIKAPHFVMYVRQKLAEQFSDASVERAGLNVTTTLDLSTQAVAEEAVASETAKLDKLRVGNAATVITRPSTGEILAMVGSKDYFASGSGNVNVVTSLRQPGSAIKPLNYAVGIETQKVTAATVFVDAPTCFDVPGQKGYCPVNYDGKFHGPQALRFSLGNSYNIPAVKMMALNGVETFIASASAMGITSFKDPSRYGLSLTLGGGEVTMLDLATAFGVFANGGTRKDLISILKVSDANGKILYEYKDPNFVADISKPLTFPSSLLISGSRVLSSETAFLISHILLDNNARVDMFGAGSLLSIPNRAVSVKTGTTDDKRDNWTVGYTPNFLTIVWVGNNDNTPMNQALTSGVTGAAPIFNRIMKTILKDQPDLWPRQPANVVGAQICTLSGKAAPNADPNASDKGCSTRYEYFIKGTVPSESELLKQSVAIDKGTQKLAQPNQTDNVENQEKQVVRDAFGLYCIDCNHDGGEPVTNVKL